MIIAFLCSSILTFGESKPALLTSESQTQTQENIIETNTQADIFWSSRDKFLAAHVGRTSFHPSSDYLNSDDDHDCEWMKKCHEQDQLPLASSSQQDDLKQSDNFQFLRIPNDYQWEAGK